MIASFRRLSKSKLGAGIFALFLLAIVASFALADIQNVVSGGFGTSGSNLASAGSEKITDREMARMMERRLAEVRQQNPEADYSMLAGDFEPLLAALLDERALKAFADKHGLTISKRLVDAEIANLPGAKGLGGQFSDQAYQAFLAQQRMTDQEVRQIIAAGLLQRLVLAPVASNARVPVGMATPYASMLLEVRHGEVAFVPASAFRAGLTPGDADLQRFYAANRARYTVPEQRVLRLAKMGPEQVAGVAATEQEIAAYYNANRAQYEAKETRALSQAVAPDRATAEAIARRARAGGSFAAAAAPAGFSAEDVSLGPQTRQQFAGIANAQVAAAAFAAPSGAVVGPVQSNLGWHVIKVESVRREGGRTLAQARAEIAARLTPEKRKNALTELVTQVEDAIADGANFTEAAALAKLPVTETPLIVASGSSRENPAYRLPADLAPALKAGFELAPNDEPVVETLANDAGYVLVAPSRVVPAAPAPFASVRDRVAADWIQQQAAARARVAATAIGGKVGRGMPVAQAVREAGTALPPVQQISQRRLEISQFGGQVPAPVQILFSLGQGKSRMVADPQGRGYFVVKVNRIIPGNALFQPALIARVQNEFQTAASDEYARQFVGAVRAEVGVRRNEAAIAAARKRIAGN